MREVENRLPDYPSVASVYARSSADRQADEEVIGTIQLGLVEWDERPTAETIGARIREDMAEIPGIEVQVQTQSMGPSSGKPVNLRILAADPAAQERAVEQVLMEMESIGGFTDVVDTRAIPGVEWCLQVDRSEAARFGADVALLGHAVQLLTQGITVADYRSETANSAVDIRVRFPPDDRTLEQLERLRVSTDAGLVPVSNFATFEPAPRTGTIKRIDQRRVITIEANVARGLLVDDQVTALRRALEAADLPEGVSWSFTGEAEDQQAAQTFLPGAFASAIALMFAILVTQFNSFYQAMVVMSAIIFSVAGCCWGSS